MKSFEDLISEAGSWKLKGWDFSSLQDRWVDSYPPWNYRALVTERLKESDSLLDLGTGGGEFLSSLKPLPTNSYATEGYPPNVPVAKERLVPKGIEVIQTYCEDNSKIPQLGSLPFRSASFDLVIDRHESYVAGEVFRILRPSGHFITQQIGSDNLAELNRLLGARIPSAEEWNIDIATKELENSKFRIIQKGSTHITSWFSDIGAVVCCLRALPWQIPDFTVAKYLSELRALDKSIRGERGLKVKASRFFAEATKKE